jgi:hypothetical protein
MSGLPGRALAQKSTTGNWIGPIPMGRIWNNPNVATTNARATHLTVLRRQTAQGDSTLIVHWHDYDVIRAWRYDIGSGGAVGFDTARARILSNPVQNEFCAGHVNLHDGRFLVVGGTAP